MCSLLYFECMNGKGIILLVRTHEGQRQQYFHLQKDFILPSTKVVEEVFHQFFLKLFIMIVLLSRNSLKSLSLWFWMAKSFSLEMGMGGQIT